MNEQEKMRRHKVAFRDEFSYEFKQQIMQKSDEKCCMCGKKCYIGYGATIDHFIPLIKGGTNDEANLVQMCEECNEEKGRQIIFPGYVKKNLTPKAYNDLCNYVEDYFAKFEYIDGHNLFCFDKICSKMSPIYSDQIKNKSKFLKSGIGIKYELIRATEEDNDMLTDYFISYLKKRDLYENDELARKTVEFFTKYYATYYAKKAGEINMLMVGSMQTLMGPQYFDFDEEADSKKIPIDKAMCLAFFPKYVNDSSVSFATCIIDWLATDIFEYYNLNFAPLKLMVPQPDSKFIGAMGYYYNQGKTKNSMSVANIHLWRDKGGDLNLEAYNEFCSKIRYNTREMKEFVEKNEMNEKESWFLWMQDQKYGNGARAAMEEAAKMMTDDGIDR